MSVRETALLLVHLAGVYGHCDRADFFEQGCLPYSIILHFKRSENTSDRNNYTARARRATTAAGAGVYNRLMTPTESRAPQERPQTSPGRPKLYSRPSKDGPRPSQDLFFRDAYPQDESRTHEGVPKRGQAAQDAPKTRRGRTMTVL